MLAIDQIKSLQPSHTFERHFLVQIDCRVIVRDYMQVDSSAGWNTWSIFYDFPNQRRSWI